MTTEITTKADMARFAREHEADTTITWAAHAGPGGTLILRDREAEMEASL